MNKLRSKRITLTLCETLIYKPQNPKPSCAEIRSSLTRRPRQTLPCAEPSCSRGDLDRPSSAQNLPAHEATSTGPPVRRTSPPAHEANSTGSPVRQNKPSCSRGDLDRPSRAQNKPSCSRGDLDRPSRAPEQAFLLTRRPRQALPCAEQAFLLTRRPRQALPCARKSLLLTRPMNMTAGAPEGRFHARKTILREGNQLVAELDFPVAEFVETLVTSTGSVPYMT